MPPAALTINTFRPGLPPLRHEEDLANTPETIS
jgi:hypothetical protein